MTTTTHFNFRSLPNSPRAEAWRALDAAVARWVLSHGGSRLLAEVAGWASYAEAQGDSALLLEPESPSRHGLRALSVEELSALAAEPMVTVLAGPEGGFTAAETADALRFGFQPLRLGPRVLRTETAAVALLASMQALWGDF